MPEETAVAHLRNTNPLGDIYLPLIGREVASGEEFEVDDDLAAVLLAQVGNYEPASPAKPAKGKSTAQEG